MARSMALQVVLVAAVLGAAVAFPNFYPDRVDENAACDAHPDMGFSGHGAPKEEAGLEFTVEKDGDAVTEFCPGGSYDVTVAFESAFKCKLTVSVGELGGADDDCSNMENFLTGDDGASAKSYTTEWTIPCDDDDESDEASFKVTGALSPSASYMTNTLTLKKADSCDKC